jgi:hypothetical protein
MAQRIGIDQRLDALQGTRIMDTDRKLGDIAANLDDMSHTLAALKDAVKREADRAKQPSRNCNETWRRPRAPSTMLWTRSSRRKS